MDKWGTALDQAVFPGSVTGGALQWHHESARSSMRSALELRAR